MENTQASANQPYSNVPPTSLPNSLAVLLLGIFSILLTCCYVIPGLICAIIALVLAKKDNQLYLANPAYYSASSYSNLKTGRVCAIIGICISALLVIFVIAITIIFGVGLFTNPEEFMRQMR